MDVVPLCPAPAELRLDRLAVSPEVITLVASARRRSARCPRCRRVSHRVHSRYVRTLADLPWHGLRVRLEAHVRKFFCDTPACLRRIFAERLPETAAPYGRRTLRAGAALELIGFAVGGRAGARLAAALGLTGGPAAVLACVRTAAEPERPVPRVLGVDDWAVRRGQRYGTILVDLERHAVVDLLPERTAETLAAWLRVHPGVELISRDRGGSYADGAREGAPHAVQIADRFHLVHNLVAALEHVCTRHHRELREATAEVAGPPPVPSALTRKRRYSGLAANRPGPTRAEQRSAERRAQRLARYTQVVELRAAGMRPAGIARAVGLDRRTVVTWLAAGHFPERALWTRGRRPLKLVERFADEIHARYDAGLDTAAALTRELRPLGYSGSYGTVGRYLAELRTTRLRRAGALPSPSTGPPPSPRQSAWLLRKADAELKPGERAYVAALCARCPEIARARELAGDFMRLLKAHDANALGPWLEAASRSELRSFATGVRRDRDAVLAGILFRWSNGQVEGHVHRLKLVKRSMYGRAGFALLRKRVLAA